MERYGKLVGKHVEAHYRASNIELSVAGTLVSDSGKSIFIEERHSEGGKQKTMRVEIPYEYIIRLVESHEQARPGPSPSKEPPASSKKKRH
jgi:hypothetical protein